MTMVELVLLEVAAFASASALCKFAAVDPPTLLTVPVSPLVVTSPLRVPEEAEPPETATIPLVLRPAKASNNAECGSTLVPTTSPRLERAKAALDKSSRLFAGLSGVNPRANCTPLICVYGIIGKLIKGTWADELSGAYPLAAPLLAVFSATYPRAGPGEPDWPMSDTQVAAHAPTAFGPYRQYVLVLR